MIWGHGLSALVKPATIRFDTDARGDEDVTKTQFISAVMEKTGLKKIQATRAVNAVLETVATELGQGGSVGLAGFGSFSTVVRAARHGRNPKTGETIEIAAHKSVRFKPGRPFKQAVA
jgi:DNA-binding protein HU-beta